MKINFNEQTNTKFSALYMPNKKNLIKKIGNNYAEQLERIRPNLEELAKDVDIYIKPQNSFQNRGSGILVKITEALTCPLKGIFGFDKGYATGYAEISDCVLKKQPLSVVLYRTILETKENFLLFNTNEKYYSN